jgi:hypothetical protein
MSKYEIHTIEGDTPYVTMSGDFSMDDLMVILDEMRDLYTQASVIIGDDLRAKNIDEATIQEARKERNETCNHLER